MTRGGSPRPRSRANTFSSFGPMPGRADKAANNGLSEGGRIVRSHAVVIPGCHNVASPESITTDFCGKNPVPAPARLWLSIPGSRLAAAPGNDEGCGGFVTDIGVIALYIRL